MKDFLLSAADRSPAYHRPVKTLDLTADEADTFFDALSSGTSRTIFERLYEEPAAASELAEELDTTVQNVHYHLKKLTAADLIESVDTVYSSRGKEVMVYAPTDQAVVLVTGEEPMRTRVKSVLTRFIGGLGALLIASLLIQAAFGGSFHYGPQTDDSPAGVHSPSVTEHTPGGTVTEDSNSSFVEDSPTVSASRSPTPTGTPTATPLGDPETQRRIPLGGVFFAGGSVVLVFLSLRELRTNNS